MNIETLVRSPRSSAPQIYSIVPGVVFYWVSILIGVVVWPFQSGIFAVSVALTFFTGSVISYAIIKYAARGKWFEIVGELFVPFMLWLWFCMGGVIALLRPATMRYYGHYENGVVVLLMFYVVACMLIYVWSFRWSYRRWRVITRKGVSKEAILRRALFFLISVFIALDLYETLKLVNRGLYFNWIAKVAYDTSVRGTDMLYHFQRIVGFVLLALLVYYIHLNRKDRFKRLIAVTALIAKLGFVFLRGDRSGFLFALVVVTLSHFVVITKRFTLRQIVSGVVFSALFFIVIGPTIQEARFIMREDVTNLTRNPAEIVLRYVTDYLPEAFSHQPWLGNSSYITVDLKGRVGSYMSYAAAMYQRILDGVPLRSGRELLEELSLLVPRMLYPQKGSFDADARLMAHFRIGQPGHDSNGSPFADVFSYLHVFGGGILFALIGMGYGAVAAYLVSRYNALGKVIFVGLLPVIDPSGDAFVGYLADLRNVMLFLLLLSIYSWLMAHFSTRH